MAGSEIVLYRMREKDVPTIQEFLLSRLKEGQAWGSTAWSLRRRLCWIWRQRFLPRGSGSGLRI